MILASGAVCYFAKLLLIPIAAAFLLYLLFNPLVRKLKEFRCPTIISSTLIMGIVSVVLVLTVSSFFTFLHDWSDDAPKVMHRIERSLESIRQPVEAVEEAAKSIEKATSTKAKSTPEVKVSSEKSVVGTLFNTSVGVTYQLLVCLGLTFFLLLSGEALLHQWFGSPNAKNRSGDMSYELMRTMEAEVSRYLIVRSLINLGLVAVTWAFLYWFEVPNALMLAILVGFLNYIPYIGPLVGLAVIETVVILEFGVPTAIQIAIWYILIQTLEGLLISPWILGDSLRLNPIIVFLSILVWGWLWGIAGAIMAVPILSIIFIFSKYNQNSEILTLMNEFPNSASQWIGNRANPQS
ncbi:MAG: AI-2E family transporter [Verrucomicrobiae bacterium]|nr:AI-2E family transporter [Verrucomicrobiae bacterium]